MLSAAVPRPSRKDKTAQPHRSLRSRLRSLLLRLVHTNGQAVEHYREQVSRPSGSHRDSAPTSLPALSSLRSRSAENGLEILKRADRLIVKRAEGLVGEVEFVAKVCRDVLRDSREVLRVSTGKRERTGKAEGEGILTMRTCWEVPLSG